jgi:hypothetical protein
MQWQNEDHPLLDDEIEEDPDQEIEEFEDFDDEEDE